MSVILDGSPASEGIAQGRVFHLDWGVPVVPHETIDEGRIAEDVERFEQALSWASTRLREVVEVTEKRLGTVEAQIFEPQILMLQDSEVVEGTLRYIRDNRMSAQRAFEWRMLELQAMWSRTSHPMVLDRLNDLEDVMIRVLNRLLGRADPTDLSDLDEGVIIVAPNLTPSLAVHFDTSKVLGIATDQGTRTAHWAILHARIEPAVARSYLKIFDGIWSASQPVAEFRRLGV